MYYYQMNNPSICIPKVDQNISKNFIYTVLNRYNFGEIKKIDMIKMNKGSKVFIHFKYWYNTDKCLKVREILRSGLDFKIIYVAPWYWKCTNVY